MAETRRRVAFIGGLGLAAALASSCARPPSASNPAAPAPGPREAAFIKSLVDSISSAELKGYVLALQNMGTRYAPSRGNLRAAEYLRTAFAAAGLRDTGFDEFSYYDEETGTWETSRNVVASKPGASSPETIVVIGAHFDGVARTAADGRTSLLDRENPAPAADDNATGVAAVLAAARVLAPLEFDRTLRFVAFSAEEAGSLGSAHYAAEAARKGERIVAMISVDMIGGVSREPEDLDIFADGRSAGLLDRITNQARIYAPELPLYRIVDDRYDGSDHGPFWNNGYPAVCLMEDYYPSSRSYHSPADTVETVHFPFFLGAARLAAGCFAEIAGLRVPETYAPPPTAAGGTRASGGVDWGKDSGRRFLVAISGADNRADVVDISLPGITSRTGVSLGEVPPETWARPRDYPVAAARRPSSRQVYVTMIRERAPGGGSERGTVMIVDPSEKRVVGRLRVRSFPSAGAFNAAGTRFYLPYRGEPYVDVFDADTLRKVDGFSVPAPLGKLVVDGRGGRVVALSSETGAVIFLNLVTKAVEGTLRGIPAARDVVLIGDGRALVCSYDPAKIFRIDTAARAVLGETETDARPVRLLVSPGGTSVLALHGLGRRAELFPLVDGPDGRALGASRILDLGEVFADAVFADDRIVYFISSSASRLLGYDFAASRVFWSLRTGGVRARPDVETILFVGEN